MLPALPSSDPGILAAGELDKKALILQQIAAEFRTMTRAPISGMEAFLAIVREGSLRGAARSLGVGAPAISHRLKAFEQRIGVDLLVRTTRSIELTEAGRTLLADAAPAFQSIVEAIERTRTVGKSTSGSLRLTMPISAYKMIVAPILADFQNLYPDVRLEVSVSEGLVDVVKEGFHAGFRLGDRLTAGMVAVRATGPLEPCYFAAKEYLERSGRPEHPRDLLAHKCIRYRYISSNRLQDWQFREAGQVKTVDAPATLIFDGMEAVRQAVRDGHGVSWSLRAMVEAELRTGILETVLDAYVVTLPPYYLFCPEQNRRLELLRLFVDFLVKRRDRRGMSVG